MPSANRPETLRNSRPRLQAVLSALAQPVPGWTAPSGPVQPAQQAQPAQRARQPEQRP